MTGMPLKRIVLVVEDEPLLLLMAGGVVEDAGFEPLYARDADEAVRILEARADVAIVFTDVNMPGSMDGIALVAVIWRRWPAIKAIVVSGLDQVAFSEQRGRSRFFRKPYDSQHIAAALIDLAA
jgi:DNA-binding NtrC family response regulator